jgi:hypothetical protein
MTDLFSRQYETGDKIIFLYKLILYFWTANWKTKYSAPNDSIFNYDLNQIRLE